jgi:hypothetical protein
MANGCHKPRPATMNLSKSLVLSVLIASTTALAQTNLYVTNFALPTSNHRTVDGQLYDVKKSGRFFSFDALCLGVFPTGVFVQDFIDKPIYERPARASSDGSSRFGNFLGSGKSDATPPPSRQIGSERVLGEKYFLKNYPTNRIATGETISGRAMRDDGTNLIDFQGERIRVYDYGLPYTNPVPVSIKLLSTNKGSKR